jgi:hypothetical protein
MRKKRGAWAGPATRHIEATCASLHWWIWFQMPLAFERGDLLGQSYTPSVVHPLLDRSVLGESDGSGIKMGIYSTGWRRFYS